MRGMWGASLGVLRRLLLAGNFGAFLAGFGQADRDGLFTALYGTALAASPGLQRASFLAAHGTLDPFAGSFAVFASA
jgi:hypothetical protein